MLHCAYTSATGIPVLSGHPYDYSDGANNTNNNNNNSSSSSSSHNHAPNHSMEVDINIPPQQSPHPHPSNLTIPRNASNHSTILQPTNSLDNCHTPHYSFSPIPLPHSPYPHNINNPSSQFYPRQEHASYINSPNSQAMPVSAGLPYISKRHPMPSTSCRSNTLIPSSSPALIKLDSSDGPDPRLPHEAELPGPSSSTAFISKLYHLCSHDDYRSYIRWNAPGDAFVLAHANADFASHVLPRFFRHNNVSSFIRQLNLYNFTRLPTVKLLETIDNTANQSPASAFSGFSHPYFRRGDENSLRLIKPKPNKNKSARKSAKSAPSSDDKGGKPGRKSTPMKIKL